MGGNSIMNRKCMIRKVLLIILAITALWLVADAFYEHQVRKENWSEKMRTTFIDALKSSMEKRGKREIYYARESYGVKPVENDMPKIVTVNTGDGDREYIIPPYKHSHNIVEDAGERLFDSIILEDRPLKADSLNMFWDSLLIKNDIPCRANVRISVTDLSENISTVYAKGSQYLSASDSLLSYYIGYRCEVEVTAFASFSYWESLTLWEKAKLFSLLSISMFLLWYRYFRKKKFVGGSGYEQLGHFVTGEGMTAVSLKENMSCIYQLGDELLFDSTNRLLKRGNQVKYLLPQVSTLLAGLLNAADYRMSIPEICLLLWPDGDGRAERVHTVVARLRSSLSELSSDILVVSGNYQYQLKIPISSKKALA